MSPIYTCDDEQSKEYVDASRVQLARFDDFAVMNGFLEFKKSFEPSTLLEVVLEKEASGRLEIMMTHELQACKEISDPGSDYATWIEFFGLPSECPFEAGLYPIHNLTADTSDMPINSANAGAYQATINMYKCEGDDCEKSFICCLKLDFCIEPI
ncbi:uncharacterized protein LOC126377238 [Pectinophora gossypiella]|uniref:uncharacterized protein LOC126377238 n=1 Tax=Pectinophora gossypiella TaxID=13191 RepID=UPI00214EA417|nr:uncharacterized protein LOC126377238 [Pectinophora gossypiella]